MTALSVSIVLPTFNRLEFLRAAVESVFAQTYKNWHLLIADDGSEANTRDYLRQLSSRAQISVLWLKHSGNPSAVRNAALRTARGDYVAFLDSDDVWMPAKLQRQIASLGASDGRRWGYTGYTRIDASGMPTVYPGTRTWVPYRGNIVEPLLTLDAEVSTPAVLVERSLLNRVGEFDEALPLFEDYDLWIRLARHSEIDLIDEPLILLRSHQQHYSGGAERVPLGRIKQLDNARRLAVSTRERRIIGRQRARSLLQLASLQVNSNRRQAWRSLLAGCGSSWQYLQWWTGLAKPLLKLAAPPAFLAQVRALRRGTSGPKK